jgi:hypothetical protein
MRKLKMILVTCVVASSLFAAAGTAWASTSTVERGTSWTSEAGSTIWGDPGGISWEMLEL